MSCLNLTRLLMQLGCAGMRLSLLAVKPGYLRIGRGLGLGLGLPLVLERSGGTVFRPLFAVEGGVMETPVTHRRSIARRG